MATYVTKSCPHCGKKYEWFSQKRIDYRSPFVVCNKCGNIFSDTTCIEISIASYTISRKVKNVIVALIVGVFFVISGIYLIFHFLNPSNIEELGFLVLLIFIPLIIGIVFTTFSVKYIRSEIPKKDPQSIIFQMSKKRLENPQYEAALMELIASDSEYAEYYGANYKEWKNNFAFDEEQSPQKDDETRFDKIDFR